MRDELIRREPELAGRVHATGTLAAIELSRNISACDVMLQPYIDGVSSRRTSLMVSLSHGIPVVTTSGRLTEPLWAESEAVALVPAEDVATLALATIKLLSDETSRRRLSGAARTLYAERFDLKRTIAALRDTLV
jgi:glycosyltransferase involved in cell wall biosynthesis